MQGRRAERPEGRKHDGAGRVPQGGGRVVQRPRRTALHWEGAHCRRSSGDVLASCRGEGGEPTGDDRGRWVSARSRTVGSTGPGCVEGGHTLVTVPDVVGCAQLGARLEWQELSRHAWPTSERLPAACQDAIAAAIVEGAARAPAEDARPGRAATKEGGVAGSASGMGSAGQSEREPCTRAGRKERGRGRASAEIAEMGVIQHSEGGRSRRDRG